ncbi:MAG TPA: hypothetical protein VGD98_05320 [Ktedonobacteraceae bacterium]
MAIIVIVSSSTFWLLQNRNSNPTPGQHQAKPSATSLTSIPTWTVTAFKPSPLAIFFDMFAGNFHGWSLGNNDGYFRFMVNDSLILSTMNPNSTLVESFPTITNLDNYVVSIDFMINQADARDSMGLYLRGDSTLDHDYRIDINGNNTLDIAKEYLDTRQSGQTELLVPPAPSAYLKPLGHANTLTVFMIGPTIIAEINNIVVMTTTDSEYTNGQIALFARHHSSPRGIVVSFTRAEIDRLASPFMRPTPTPTLTPTASPGQP